MSSKYVSLRGKDLSVRINTQYIVAYTYDQEEDETVVWLLGVESPVHYPGDQRKEINMAITST